MHIPPLPGREPETPIHKRMIAAITLRRFVDGAEHEVNMPAAWCAYTDTTSEGDLLIQWYHDTDGPQDVVASVVIPRQNVLAWAQQLIEFHQDSIT